MMEQPEIAAARQPQIVRELYHTYLVMDAGIGADAYGIKILQNNTLTFFLPFELRSSDKTENYYYELTSQTRLKKQLENGLGREPLEAFAASLLGALDEIHEYLLDEKDMILSEDYIFRNPDGGYCFVYYPGYQKELTQQLGELCALFLKRADYTCTEAVRRIYEFYHKVGGENCSVKSLREFVFEKNGEKSNISGSPEALGEDEIKAAEKEMGTEGEEDDCRAAGERADTAASARYLSAGAAGYLSEHRYPENSGRETEYRPDSSVGRETKYRPDGSGGRETKYRSDGSGGRGTEYRPEDDGDANDSILQSILHHAGGRLWVTVGILCLCELGGGIVCMKVLNTVPHLWVAAAVGAVIGLTVTAAAAIMFLKQKKESQDDFWEPEDYISCDWGKDTTVLHGTTLLRDRAPQVLFKSTVSGLCADLNISAFPAIIGKEAADSRCRILVPTVSRRHARLEYKEKSFYLTDLHSSNGTFINGEMIPPMKPSRLQPGDSVIFSDVEFIFEQSEEKQ